MELQQWLDIHQRSELMDFCNYRCKVLIWQSQLLWVKIWGQNNIKRVRQGVKAAWLMCSIVILAGSITMGLFGSELVGIFTNDKAVIAAGVTMINVFSTMLYYFTDCSNS